jgi:hypothetical protein
LGSLALTGAVCLALPVGWTAVNPSPLGSRLLTVALSLLVAPPAVFVLISPAAAIASLAGLLAGCALRLLLDFFLAHRATT